MCRWQALVPLAFNVLCFLAYIFLLCFLLFRCSCSCTHLFSFSRSYNHIKTCMLQASSSHKYAQQRAAAYTDNNFAGGSR